MPAKKVTFEQQLESLEAIVEKLEDGDLSLEDSLAHYEKGIKLTKECQKLLDKAQQKVSILNEDNLEDFDAD
jgi:exodeoxyribonuclease VII small subunit